MSTADKKGKPYLFIYYTCIVIHWYLSAMAFKVTTWCTVGCHFSITVF